MSIHSEMVRCCLLHITVILPRPRLLHELKAASKSHKHRNILQGFSVSSNLEMTACLFAFEPAFCIELSGMSHKNDTNEDYNILWSKNTPLVHV